MSTDKTTGAKFARMGTEFAGDVPEGVEVDQLMIVFAVDGETLVTPDGKTLVWVDMRTAPVVGDIVLSQALGLEAGDAYTCTGRGWMDHNLLNVVLVDGENEEPAPITARVRAVGGDMDDLGAPPEGFVFMCVEVPVADVRRCHGDHVQIAESEVSAMTDDGGGGES